MIDVFPFSGFPVGVLGLGRSGLATALALQESTAEVWAWDDDPKARLIAENEGVSIVNLYSCDWSQLTSLIVSPGVPIDYPAIHPIVARARKVNCEVIGDIELLVRTQRWCGFIGITGTNGKSTTTTLLGHIMQLAGREAEVGGNLGIPVLSLDPLGANGTYVLEMSSYQLELTPSATFDVAILLNISADHLERHGGIEGYIQAKQRIFQRQTKPRTAILGVDDEICWGIYCDLETADEQIVIPVSGSRPVKNGVYAVDGILFDCIDGTETPICKLYENPSLLGSHNGQNAAAAYAAAKTVGVAPHAIMACLKSYPGLVHRQEAVSIVDGVAYVNDSKATNDEAAARAISCFDNIYWIVGGRSKEGNLSACLPHLQRVRHVYLIGEAASDFSHIFDGRVTFTLSGDLASAVKSAHNQAQIQASLKPVVLLSPACASFDQYTNFEERGDTFKALVDALPGTHVDPFEENGIFPGTALAHNKSELGV